MSNAATTMDSQPKGSPLHKIVVDALGEAGHLGLRFQRADVILKGLDAAGYRVVPATVMEKLTADLATCYRLSGADPDGNEDWRLAPYAVEEVRRLREEADEADAALERLAARVAQLEDRDPLDIFEGKP